jgi:CxxC motif-containing protein
MPKEEYTCVACPKGCTVEVEFEGDEIKDISGYSCAKGEEYVKSEFHDPRRILTTTVKIKNAKYPRIPVRTETGVPKDELDCCLDKINDVELEAPVEVGEVVIDDICGTDIPLLTSRSLELVSEDAKTESKVQL